MTHASQNSQCFVKYRDIDNACYARSLLRRKKSGRVYYECVNLGVCLSRRILARLTAILGCFFFIHFLENSPLQLYLVMFCFAELLPADWLARGVIIISNAEERLCCVDK